MARTLNGNCIGAAARIEHKDRFEREMDAIDSLRRARQQYQITYERYLLGQILDIDPQFADFWDSDAVPAYGLASERLSLLERKLVQYQLCTALDAWQHEWQDTINSARPGL